MAIEITSENFEAEVLGSDIPVLIDFWASWCGPCRMLAPTIDEIAQEYQGKIKVGKVNVDQEALLAVQFNVASIPTLKVFKNGQLAGSTVGVQSKDDILKLLDI